MQAQANRHSIFQRSISEIAQGTSTSAENLDATDGSGAGNNSKILVRRRNNSGANSSGNAGVLFYALFPQSDSRSGVAKLGS